MEKTLQEILIKLEQLENRIEYIEKKLNISSPIDRELLNRACMMLLKSVQATTLQFQQELGISRSRSIKLYGQLEDLGIVKTVEVNADPMQPYKVGKISKYKIRKYQEENR